MEFKFINDCLNGKSNLLYTLDILLFNFEISLKVGEENTESEY